MDISIRTASAPDAPRIGALHCASWRDSYAKILTPAYLAGPIEAERYAFWRDRFAAAQDAETVLVAESAPGSMVGFLALSRNADREWGSWIENLHVAKATRGGGVGERLLRAAGRRLVETEAAAKWSDATFRAYPPPIELRCCAFSGRSFPSSPRHDTERRARLTAQPAFGKGRPYDFHGNFEMTMSPAAARGGGFLRTLARRPRLIICIVIGALAYLVTPHEIRQATRALIGWNVGAWAFLVLVAHMMSTSRGDGIRTHAAQEDEKPAALLVIAVVAALASIAAILWELGPVKDMKGASKALHLGLVGATVLSAWAFTHMMFALHYAAQYYFADGSDDDGVRGGFLFPECKSPGWVEFCYEAFTIGCACATADVNLTTRGARVTALIQSVIAFFFNTIILALTINIGAGLIS